MRILLETADIVVSVNEWGNVFVQTNTNVSDNKGIKIVVDNKNMSIMPMDHNAFVISKITGGVLAIRA